MTSEDIKHQLIIITSAIWQQAAHTTYHHFLAAQQAPYKKALSLKMVNIHEYLSAMKINWLWQIFQPDNCRLAKNVLFAVCPAFANIQGFRGEYANIVHW